MGRGKGVGRGGSGGNGGTCVCVCGWMMGCLVYTSESAGDLTLMYLVIARPMDNTTPLSY